MAVKRLAIQGVQRMKEDNTAMRTALARIVRDCTTCRPLAETAVQVVGPSA
jgi:hypothetical protein